MEEEKGGVVEGGGGLGNAPYRSAPRGPPVIGSAWRARLAKYLAFGQVPHAHTVYGLGAHETQDARKGALSRKKARKLTSAVEIKDGGICGDPCWTR